MAANLFRLKKMKINVEFKGRNFSTEVQPYKTIRYVKEQARNFFYPTPDTITIYYQNKDLTSYESNLIGDYFKKRTTVALRLMPMNTSSNPEMKQKINSSNSVSDRFPIYLCSCNQEGIEYYCRTCKDFICNACRMSATHSKHNVVQVDTENLEESAKLYAITLQADILYNIKSTHDYYVKFQNQNFIEASARQEIFIRKLNKIHSIYNEMIKELSFDRTQSVEALLDGFNQQAKKAHVELESILTLIYQKYNKGRQKMSYGEMKELYEEINIREKTFEEESCDALAYKVNYEINTNIDAMYNRLEEISDEMLNLKIPFGLNLNSYYTYEMIKDKNARLNNYKDEDQSIQYLEKKDEEKIAKEVLKIDQSPKKELKQVPTGSIQFKNRYVINAKDRDSSEVNNNGNNTKRTKEINQKNIIADKGYDECVNISEHNLIMPQSSNDNGKERPIDDKRVKNKEEDELIDLLIQNDKKKVSDKPQSNSQDDRNDYYINDKDKKSIDNDNKEDEDNDLLDSIELR